MGFAGSNDGLFANDPFTIQSFQVVQRIVDTPMPGGQLHGILALIFNGYRITKGEVHFVIFEERSLKTRMYRNLYALGYLSNHDQLVYKNVSRQQKEYTEQC